LPGTPAEIFTVAPIAKANDWIYESPVTWAT